MRVQQRRDECEIGAIWTIRGFLGFLGFLGFPGFLVIPALQFVQVVECILPYSGP